jgi:hypothetical protein
MGGYGGAHMGGLRRPWLRRSRLWWSQLCVQPRVWWSRLWVGVLWRLWLLGLAWLRL